VNDATSQQLTAVEELARLGLLPRLAPLRAMSRSLLKVEAAAE
jgi:hypothetical protein